MNGRGLRLLAVSGLVAGALSSCGGEPTLSVTPRDALFDTTLHVRVEHAAGDTVRLTTEDADGHRWVSTAKVPSDGSGDLGPQLTDRLARADKTPAAYAYPARPTVTATLLRGERRLASQTVVRRTPTGAGLVRETKLRPKDPSGLFGDLWVPVRMRPGATAVLKMGGSEGGVSDALAAMLAAHGHATLVVGYFKVPGKPSGLQNVPLEQFHEGLRRLAMTPGVDPSRIDVLGISRGSEAALLTATTWPEEVHGVIVGAPSSVVHGSFPADGLPAWTLSGRAVPYSRTNADPESSDNQLAKIDVAKINGHLMAVCGEMDLLWPSCLFSDGLHEGAPARTLVLRYSDAGHFVGGLLPNSPTTNLRLPDGELTGGTSAANAAARRDAWPTVLDFLSRD